MKLKIEYLNKEELKPYANNAKLHPAEQIEQIKESIKDFGFNDPIAVWHDNEVIEGHGRLLAVMEMPEITEVPVIRLDELTDEERRAYMLVHNKLTMNSNFDFAVLDLELEGIDLDMEKFGFAVGLDEYIDSFFGDEEELGGAEDREEFHSGTFESHTESQWKKLKSLCDKVGIIYKEDV